MPGKHAPASSKSFLVSLATAAGGAIAALAVVVGIALVALNAGSEEPTAEPTVRPPTTQAPTTPPVTTSPTTSPEPTATESPSPAPDTAAVKDTTLRVLNGTDRAGLARSVADRAKSEGYPDPKVGNTARTAKSTVYYRADSREEAEEFQRRFPEFTEIAQAPSTFQTDVMLTVVIGLDYPTASPSPSP